MKDVLCGLLSLTALWQFLLALRPEASRRHYAWATAAYAAALLAKPSAVVVPLIAALLSAGSGAKRWKRPTLILWLLLAAGCLAMTMRAQPSREPPPPLWERPLVAGDALAFYLGKLVWPRHLAIDYGRRPDVVLAHGWGYAAWLVPAGAALAAAMLRRRVPKLAVGLGVFAVALLPVLGLTPFDFQGYSTVADHYLYMPMLGIGLAVAAMVQERGKVATAALLLAVAVLGVRSFRQCRYWHDDLTIFSHTLAVNPTSIAGLNGLSRLDLAAGKNGPAQAYARQLIAAQPQSALGYIDLGAALRRDGHVDEAVASWRQGLDRSPQSVYLLLNLAMAVSGPGHNQEAIEYLRRAAAAEPDNQPVQYNLGAMLLEDGRANEAAEPLARAVELAPRDTSALVELATVLAMQGDLDGAQRQLEKALEVDPQFAPARRMLEKVQRAKARGPAVPETTP
jgi:Flp pilus assembly protein TadD